MTSRRRTNEIITLEILKLCMKGATKTQIVYQANLNFMTAKPYIEQLINNGLIEAVPKGSRVIYKTTAKGDELTRVFRQFHSEMGRVLADV